MSGFASNVFDGVFVGAGWTRAMVLTMGIALATFASLLSLVAAFGDGALWFDFCLFLLLKGLGQALMLPACKAKLPIGRFVDAMIDVPPGFHAAATRGRAVSQPIPDT